MTPAPFKNIKPHYQYEKKYDSPLLISIDDLPFLIIYVSLTLFVLKHFHARAENSTDDLPTSAAEMNPATPTVATIGGAIPVVSAQTANVSLIDSKQIVTAGENLLGGKTNIEKTTDSFMETKLLVDDEGWIEQLNPDFFIIQFGTTTDIELLDDLIPVINRGEPITVYPFTTMPNGRLLYGVATGVYENVDEALASIQELPYESRIYNPWIRSIAELKAQIGAVKSRTDY